MRVLELECKVEMKPYGINARFSGGFENKIIEMTTDEEYKQLKQHVKDIIEIIGIAIAREVNELEKEDVDLELQPELEELLDEAKVKLEKIKTPGEKMDYVLGLIDKALKMEIK